MFTHKNEMHSASFSFQQTAGRLSKVCLVRAQKSSLRNPKLQVLVPKLQVQDKTRSHMHTYVLKTSLTREFSATYMYIINIYRISASKIRLENRSAILYYRAHEGGTTTQPPTTTKPKANRSTPKP